MVGVVVSLISPSRRSLIVPIDAESFSTNQIITDNCAHQRTQIFDESSTITFFTLEIGIGDGLLL